MKIEGLNDIAEIEHDVESNNLQVKEKRLQVDL